MKHVILTGEVGAGKSTVLDKILQLLDARAKGIETGAYTPREEKEKTLYMRAYGDKEKGVPFMHLPGGDKAYAARCFDTVGVQLLRRAGRTGELIVIDEMGWLERNAVDYQEELRTALDGDIPVLAVLRQNKAEWADWIRNHPDVQMMTVSLKNRNELPKLAAEILRPQIQKKAYTMDEPVCYMLCGQKQECEQEGIRFLNQKN